MQGLDLIYSTLKLLKMIHDDPKSNGAKLLPEDTLGELAANASGYMKSLTPKNENVILGPATMQQLENAIKECENVSGNLRNLSEDAANGDGPDTELLLEKIDRELTAICIPEMRYLAEND